jgi:inner membrane transporter RhtA
MNGEIRDLGKSRDARRPIVDSPRVATVTVDKTKRGPSARSALADVPLARSRHRHSYCSASSAFSGLGIGQAPVQRVGSFGHVALRLFFAAAVLMLLWRPSLRMNRRTWTVVLGYGVILGLMNLCFYLALARIPLGIAVTIEFLGPLAVALAGSRRWLDAFWAVLAAGGVVLLMEGRGDLNLVGFLFALAAGTCWGLYILVGAALGRHTTRRQRSGSGNGRRGTGGCAIRRGRQRNGADSAVGPGAGLGVALLSSVIPYSLDLEALRKIPPRVFGILMSLEPAMAALIGLVVLQESLHWSQWIAVLCVVAASAGATRGARPDH